MWGAGQPLGARYNAFSLLQSLISSQKSGRFAPRQAQVSWLQLSLAGWASPQAPLLSLLTAIFTDGFSQRDL